MAALTLDDLLTACAPGGPSVLTSVTELEPAAGEQASVAPARFVSGRNNSVFAYETRYIDGEAQRCVLIDSKQSQLNRIEMPILGAMRDGHRVLGRVPHVEVRYADDERDVVFTDLELPHRAFDGHIRAGWVDGTEVPKSPVYRAVRDSSPANAKALVEFSPGSLVFGAWDSTRRSRQGRYRSALVGEIVGVLADQSEDSRPESLRGGARVDPVGMSIQLDDQQLLDVMARQRADLSPKLVKSVEDAAKKRGENADSASQMGLGGIPPSLSTIGGVSCSRIIRSHVLSFATLRQLRFGAPTPDGDVAVRALLAAYALAGLARSDAELYLRANCDLVEKDHPVVTLDGRYGATSSVEPLKIDDADGLLEAALDRAVELGGIRWDGQVFTVDGDPAIYQAALGDTTEEE